MDVCGTDCSKSGPKPLAFIITFFIMKTLTFINIFPDIDCILHPSVRAAGDQSTEAVHGNELTESAAAGAQPFGATGTAQSQLLPVGLRPDIHRIRHQTVWIHWRGSDQVRAKTLFRTSWTSDI